MADGLTEATPDVYLYDPLYETNPLVITLYSCGVNSYFRVINHIISECKDQNIPKIDLTAEEAPWEPSDPEYLALEDWMIDFKGLVLERYPEVGGYMQINMISSLLIYTSCVTVYDNSDTTLQNNVFVSMSKFLTASTKLYT